MNKNSGYDEPKNQSIALFCGLTPSVKIPAQIHDKVVFVVFPTTFPFDDFRAFRTHRSSPSTVGTAVL